MFEKYNYLDKNKYEMLGKDLLHILKHAIGYPKGYRNYFCAVVNEEDYKQWEILCGMKLAKYGPYINEERDRIFYVSNSGIALLRALYYNEVKTEKVIDYEY